MGMTYIAVAGKMVGGIFSEVNFKQVDKPPILLSNGAVLLKPTDRSIRIVIPKLGLRKFKTPAFVYFSAGSLSNYHIKFRMIILPQDITQYYKLGVLNYI